MLVASGNVVGVLVGVLVGRGPVGVRVGVLVAPSVLVGAIVGVCVGVVVNVLAAGGVGVDVDTVPCVAVGEAVTQGPPPAAATSTEASVVDELKSKPPMATR